MAGGAVLRALGLGKAFGGIRTLSNVSAGFRAGLLTSSTGPNGAGKSAVFNLLAGAFPSSEGRVLFDGRGTTGLPQHRFARLRVVKSFQTTAALPRLGVQENARATG